MNWATLPALYDVFPAEARTTAKKILFSVAIVFV
jgi:hypothetical protein